MAFILVSEAANITGVSPQTIRKWIDRGIFPYQKIGRKLYVDKDTIDAFSEKMRDLDSALKGFQLQKEEYLRQKEEYRRMYDEIRWEHNVKRSLSICVNSGLRTRFFDSIIHIMRNEGTLNERETRVLSEVLKGTNLSDIAESLYCKRDTILQIAEKAIRKSRYLVIPQPKEDKGKEEEIKALKDEITVLKKMLYRDAIRVTEDGLNEAEKRLARMDKLEMVTLLSKRLDNENFSGRTRNVLACYSDGVHQGIRTLGELCRISQKKFARQYNVGEKTISELTDCLTANGLTWGMNIDRILGLF